MVSTSGVNGNSDWIPESLFNELNTDKSTISTAEVLGYDLEDSSTPEEFINEKQQYLSREELMAGVKTGKIDLAQYRYLDVNGDNIIEDTEFGDRKNFTAEYASMNEIYNSGGTPAEVVDSSDPIGSIMCAPGTINANPLNPYNNMQGPELFGKDYGDNTGVYTWDTPELTVIEDWSQMLKTDENGCQKKNTLTINVKDPSKVRIGVSNTYTTCLGNIPAFQIDSNNDGISDYNFFGNNDVLVNIIIGGKTYDLNEYFANHPELNQNPDDGTPVVYNYSDVPENM